MREKPTVDLCCRKFHLVSPKLDVITCVCIKRCQFKCIMRRENDDPDHRDESKARSGREKREKKNGTQISRIIYSSSAMQWMVEWR